MAAARQRQQEESTGQRILMQLGFSDEASQVICNQAGIVVASELINLEKKDIDDILKIVQQSATPHMVVNFLAQRQLSDMSYWVQCQKRLNLSISLNEFTLEIRQPECNQ